MGEIIAVTTTCSCGKQKGHKFLTREIFECECVGPKSWSQLLKLTRLHRNTLSKACKYLVKKGVLTRTVLKKKGHHVTYSMNNSFYDNYKLRAEIELTAKERRQLFRDARKTRRYLRFFAEEYQRMHRYYRNRMRLMKEQWPELEKLPAGQYWHLVRLIDILGEEDGMRRFLEERERLRATKQ